MHMLIVHSRRCACRDLSALSTCRRRLQPIIGPVSRGAGIAKYCLSRGKELAQNYWKRYSELIKLRFHDETSEITNLYVAVTEDPESQWVHEREVHPQENPHHETEVIHTPKEHQIGLQHVVNLRSPSVPNTAAENPSPASISIISSSSSRTRSSYTTLHTFTEREAILIRNFVENMALWADITDPKRHFEIEVPARALKDSVLRLAVLAFSSRHLNRRNTEDAPEALQYHNDCVKLLIPAMSEPEQHITEDILASVAILRQHEEMDGEDNQFHLTGTTRILNTVSIFGSSGGLGEAAAWLCLRQDIYVALTTQQPLRTDLQNFLESDVFDRDDDFAWSSRMVFLLAKALQGVFAKSSNSKSIDEEVQEWYANKPHTFEPIRVVPRGSEIENRFPAIWMLLPVHGEVPSCLFSFALSSTDNGAVVGLQYYHMTKIVLALSQSSTASSTYETLRQSRLIESIVA
ncbi:unnamed protein product [Penicillium pancosmium]